MVCSIVKNGTLESYGSTGADLVVTRHKCLPTFWLHICDQTSNMYSFGGTVAARLVTAQPQNIDRNPPDSPRQHSHSPTPAAPPPPSTPGRPDSGPAQDSATLPSPV
ncbi:hypothetical protein TWF192_004806 [Orbilia oligospora]|uniref:Uncharacterized protein n=1 Tax=Orbilia oligospora TaxID=2813651 RepID=A0A6G1MBT4_ORBOL|nr:hypothetical protein TWF191_007967 [Orbilia oligospora]KAF3251850.1 hypothetical protein TWF192_004806 [Orbilia oligospora]